ncbi:MAG: cobalamin B12-binding domain-containing protein [Coprothermobacterota bacterium]|nr:cobalamin B12-binding domain-containing protein [Coprothermobacterota bacterium]
MKIVGAAVGNDVHIAGLLNFFRLAEEAGHRTVSLGVAIPVAQLLEAAVKERADAVAVSYRLSPESASSLFLQLKELILKYGLQDKIFLFGGTPPVAELAKKSGIFQRVFSGLEPLEELKSFLAGEEFLSRASIPPQNLVERIDYLSPYPLIRHHFGLPDLEETIKGVRRIAQAGIVDIISLGPDQNAQESFFRPQEMDHRLDGAGGVPLRSEEDLIRIYEESRCGNYPLLRCYAGTRDLLKWAEMTVRLINNAFGAVPIFWYSELDGRSKRPLREAIAENLEVMRWYGERKIPLEVNDPHQWSLRYAPDAVAITDAYLGAYIAKKSGVTVYVQQYMFNTPPETTAVYDLGKMLAQKELISTLEDQNFRIVHMVRAGLAHFSPDPYIAKGQLAASTSISLELKPQILHIVGYCEGDHAVTPEELIESVKIARGVLRNLLNDSPSLSLDPRVQRRKKELLEDAHFLLETIRSLRGKTEDPFTDVEVLAQVVEKGIFDAPHLKGRPCALGTVSVYTQDGSCRSYDPKKGKPISERERLRNQSF